jgi:hypothetical protein
MIGKGPLGIRAALFRAQMALASSHIVPNLGRSAAAN